MSSGQIPIIRNEELILLRAEAKFFTNDIPGAIADLNIVRTLSGGLTPIVGVLTERDIFGRLVGGRVDLSLPVEGLMAIPPEDEEPFNYWKRASQNIVHAQMRMREVVEAIEQELEVTAVQLNLLDQLRLTGGPARPNLVLFDIQPDQLAAVERELSEAGLSAAAPVPIVPMRIASVKGRPVQRILADHPRIHLLEPLDYVAFFDLIFSGQLDHSLPFVKRQAVLALAGDYKTTDEAMKGIATSFR